jgi:murein DD-endopeptidase MepM/ murein hydrolase activator NlpD
MKKIILICILTNLLNTKTYAELDLNTNEKFLVSAETVKLSKKGILLGEFNNNLNQNPFNGLYFDKTGNLDFNPMVLKSLKITDLDEDDNYYFATSYMNIDGQQGLFKIKKDFSQIENIGIKASLRQVLSFKNKIYVGGYVHGCYVVNKDGSNLTQILGDGYYGPQIDDIKANSKDVYILSRGLLYKVNYETNQKEQILLSQRPAFMEIDEERIYIAAYNKFFYLSYNNQLSNEKTFINKINYLKKHNNLIILVESDSTYNYFWISNDKGQNFFKSKTTLPAQNIVKDIEIIGDGTYVIYLLTNQGLTKGKLIFDFYHKNVFNSPFELKNSSELKDKITSFFDHRYPYLGNKGEPSEYNKTTLNYKGEELPEPYQYYSSHDGIDWALPINTPIYSVDEGFASYFYQENGLGHSVKISHPNGYITIYGHLDSEGLITKEGQIKVLKGQKIGKVGMSGNTSGPHLHFTTYFGEKLLQNKVDPFGWEGKFQDPWQVEGKISTFLWKESFQNSLYQYNPNQKSSFYQENLSIEMINFSLSQNPVSIEIERTTPIYDRKNYNYLNNTSIYLSSLDFESKTIPQSVLGLIKFSGFKNGDDKIYSIWKYNKYNAEKLDTSISQDYKTLNTIFEPNSNYLILKDNYQKISIKNQIKTIE